MKTKPTYEELEIDYSQLEKKLRKARLFSEEIMTYMTEGLVLTDPRETVVFINQRLSEMLGYPPEQIIGKCWLDMVSAEQQTIAQEVLARRAQGHTDRYEIILRHRDGHKFPVLIGAGPRFDKQNGEFIGTMGVVNDITERKQMEETLREKTIFLQNIIDTTSDLVSVTDMQGTFTFIGPSHSILGYDPDSLIGRNAMEFVHPDDYQETATAFANFLANREDGQKVEYRYRQADGEYLWFETVGKFILDDAGNPKEILFRTRDFTARKQAERELKRIEWMLSKKPISNIKAQAENHDQGYGDLTELNHNGIILKSIGHERLESFANDYLELLGTSSAIYEINGDYAFGIFASGWCRMMDSASRKLCDTPDNVEALDSGRWLCHESCWTDCAKAAIAKRAQVDIECNGGIRMYAVPIFASGNVVGVINFGYGDPPKDPERIKTLADVYHLNYDDLLREAKAYDSRPPYIIETAKKRLNSTAKLIGSMVETSQAMEALRESEEKHRRLFKTMAQGVVYHAADATIISVNPSAERILGLSFEQMRGKTSMDPNWRMIKEDGTEVTGTDHPSMIALRTGKTVGPVFRGVFHPEKNNHVWLSITAIPLFQPGETKPFQVYSTFEDITERKWAEEEYKTLFREMLDGFALHEIICDVSGEPTDYRFLAVNPAFERMTGLKAQDIIGRTILEVLPGAERYWIETYGKVALTGEPAFFENYSADIGKHFEVTAFQPAPRQFACLFQDITDRKQAEAEREKLQAQLHQAQKMESIGRLAGGVAHDFNNMLSVILGHTEMALEKLDQAEPLFAGLQAVQQAAERSAALTRQLLTFARKQTVAPKVIDLNETLEGMLKMLRRLIGEDIDLTWQPGKKLAPVKVDPSQIDQILVNLCVNARDAIAGVGKITIETASATFDEAYCAAHLGFVPGEYVLLAVSDDGHGMDQETLGHIFEPFFTTKEQSKGTGLGLASLYGAVKQNNGFINVYSEPGQGTTFRIYLPRYTAKSTSVAEKAPDRPAERGHETILLVEDEAAILEMTTKMLERLGYTVLAAGTPGEAIRLAHEYSGRIDLLLTDVVMPEMNGRDLAKNLLSSYPDIKRLFMSGYTANVIAHHGVLDEGVHFIQKPFSMKDLGGKLREALEG